MKVGMAGPPGFDGENTEVSPEHFDLNQLGNRRPN
jgi:hypothetical protein